MAKVGALTITPQPPIHIIPIMPSSVAGDWAYLATNPLRSTGRVALDDECR